MTGTALFKDSLAVINVGLAGFAENVTAAGGECLQLEWQPPATNHTTQASARVRGTVSSYHSRGHPSRMRGLPDMAGSPAGPCGRAKTALFAEASVASHPAKSRRQC